MASVAVLIPCLNEQSTISSVVQTVKRALPEAEIWVCDNASTDDTARAALQAGARVVAEPLPGKGNAVRRLFGAADADYYVLVDGDSTYDVKEVSSFIQRMQQEQLDFLNVARVTEEKQAYRPGHRLGNWVLSRMMRLFFGNQIQDMLSGYKIFSRRFVKTFPAVSCGFETETELTVYALSCRMPLAEVSAPYYARPGGSVSKLSTFQDGIKILQMLFTLVKEERPLLFFTGLSLLCAFVSVFLAVPIFVTYSQTGLVPKLPTAVLSTGLMIWALLFFVAGVVLDTLSSARRELRRQAYLNVSVRK